MRPRLFSGSQGPSGRWARAAGVAVLAGALAFPVSGAAHADDPVSPPAPITNDQCGWIDDTFTIPDTSGEYTYWLDPQAPRRAFPMVEYAPGEHPRPFLARVVFYAVPGGDWDAVTVFEVPFSSEPCYYTSLSLMAGIGRCNPKTGLSRLVPVLHNYSSYRLENLTLQARHAQGRRTQKITVKGLDPQQRIKRTLRVRSADGTLKGLRPGRWVTTLTYRDHAGVERTETDRVRLYRCR